MSKRRSFREINDAIEDLCYYGLDLPDEYETGLTSPVEEQVDEDALEKAFDDLQMEAEEKMENIGKFLLNTKDEIDDLKREIKRLTTWKNSLEGRSDWLKWYCMTNMIRAGIKKFTGKFVKLSVRKSPTSATYPKDYAGKPIPTEIDEAYVTEVVTHKVDSKTAIQKFNAAWKAFEKTGKPIEEFEFEIKGFQFNYTKNHLVIS